MTTQRQADEASNFAQGLRDRYGVELWMMGPDYGSKYEPAIVTIESIVVPKENRRQGVGSTVMFEVVRWADQNGYILALTPSSDFGSKVTMLRKFYKQFGFVRNLGRNKDFRTARAMIRYPKKKKASDMSLRSKIVKLAYNNPELRSELLPLLKESAKKKPFQDMPQRIKALRKKVEQFKKEIDPAVEEMRGKINGLFGDKPSPRYESNQYDNMWDQVRALRDQVGEVEVVLDDLEDPDSYHYHRVEAYQDAVDRLNSGRSNVGDIKKDFEKSYKVVKKYDDNFRKEWEADEKEERERRKREKEQEEATERSKGRKKIEPAKSNFDLQTINAQIATSMSEGAGPYKKDLLNLYDELGQTEEDEADYKVADEKMVAKFFDISAQEAPNGTQILSVKSKEGMPPYHLQIEQDKNGKQEAWVNKKKIKDFKGDLSKVKADIGKYTQGALKAKGGEILGEKGGGKGSFGQFVEKKNEAGGFDNPNPDAKQKKIQFNSLPKDDRIKIRKQWEKANKKKASWAIPGDDLRASMVRLAYHNPDLREDLLPVLKQAAYVDEETYPKSTNPKDWAFPTPKGWNGTVIHGARARRMGEPPFSVYYTWSEIPNPGDIISLVAQFEAPMEINWREVYNAFVHLKKSIQIAGKKEIEKEWKGTYRRLEEIPVICAQLEKDIWQEYRQAKGIGKQARDPFMEEWGDKKVPNDKWKPGSKHPKGIAIKRLSDRLQGPYRDEFDDMKESGKDTSKVNFMEGSFNYGRFDYSRIIPLDKAQENLSPDEAEKIRKDLEDVIFDEEDSPKERATIVKELDRRYTMFKPLMQNIGVSPSGLAQGKKGTTKRQPPINWDEKVPSPADPNRKITLRTLKKDYPKEFAKRQKMAIAVQRFPAQRVRGIVKQAGNMVKDHELKDWFFRDEVGFWEKQARELLETTAEKAALHNMTEAQVDEEIARHLAIMALQGKINVMKRRKKAQNLDPDQERMLNAIVMNAVSNGDCYRKGKDARCAVDQAIREEVVRAIETLTDDSKVIVNDAVRLLEKLWGHSEEEQLRLKRWIAENEERLFSGRWASKFDPDQESLLQEVLLTASNYGEFYPQYPTKATVKAIKDIVAYKSRDIRSDAREVKNLAIKEVARQWAMP